MDIERNDNVIMITCDFSRYSVNRITSTAVAFPISTSFFSSASMLHANASEKQIVLWFCVGQNKNGDKLSKKKLCISTVHKLLFECDKSHWSLGDVIAPRASTKI